jgi:membrane associated rhomboid family serine protease
MRSLTNAIFPPEVRAGFALLCTVIAAMWILFAVDTVLLFGRLDELALVPRSSFGLIGILCAPFLHVGLEHLIGNTIGLFFIGILLIDDHGKRPVVVASLLIILGGGALTWCLGRYARHLGASGLVYGWLGFMMAHGFVARRAWPILRSVLYTLFFSGMLMGLLPTTSISWEGHLFGFLAGIVAAQLIARRRRTTFNRSTARRY